MEHLPDSLYQRSVPSGQHPDLQHDLHVLAVGGFKRGTSSLTGGQHLHELASMQIWQVNGNLC